MTTVSVNKEVTIKTVESVDLPAPSYWRDTTSSFFHIKEDGTVISVMKRLIAVGDIDSSLLKSNLAHVFEITRDEFLSELKKTQRYILSETANV